MTPVQMPAWRQVSAPKCAASSPQLQQVDHLPPPPPQRPVPRLWSRCGLLAAERVAASSNESFSAEATEFHAF